MSLTVWEINGLSLELDLGDADVMERYEKAFEEMADTEKLLPKDGKASEKIRAYCNMFRKFFDKIFGSETSEKLFAGVPVKTSAYEDVYFSFLEFAEKQLADSAKQRAERLSRYRPNRKQRRSKKK